MIHTLWKRRIFNLFIPFVIIIEEITDHARVFTQLIVFHLQNMNAMGQRGIK